MATLLFVFLMGGLFMTAAAGMAAAAINAAKDEPHD